MSNSLIALTAQLYIQAAKHATIGVRRSWILLPGAAVLFLLARVASTLLGGMGMAGGFVIGFFQIYLISLLYRWMWEATEQTSRTRSGFDLKEMFRFDMPFFSATLSVAFLLFLLKWGLTLASLPPQHMWIHIGVLLLVAIGCNPVPEVIIVDRYEGVHALAKAWSFVQANWIEWFLPFVVLLLPWIFTTPETIPLIWASSELLLPARIILQATQYWVPSAWGAILVGVVVGIWYMFFRIELYKSLDAGSRRQRAFQAKMR